jgi:hypothetical protein
MVRLSEVLEDYASLTSADLAQNAGERLYLRSIELVVSRADAVALLSAYRGGPQNLQAIRALHARLGPA